MTKKFQFHIDHIDSLGQGVMRGERVGFFQNTLPGETGSAKTIKEKKKILFGYLESEQDLTHKSDKRIHPECPHYFACGGCHYQHTDYAYELELKRQALTWNLRKITDQNVQVHYQDQRFGYRNRLQLHYDKNQKVLGLISRCKSQILQIEECLLPQKLVKEKLNSLYKNQEWLNLVQGQPAQGHIEIYLKDEANISVELNSPYAHGGFTQVNSWGNQCLKDLVLQEFTASGITDAITLDLYGGDGNLSRNIPSKQTLIVDSSPTPKRLQENQSYLQFKMDLREKSLKTLLKQIQHQLQDQIDLLIVDPPRAGFKQLNELARELQPSYIFYISCESSTLSRDLQSLNNYLTKEVHLVDLFPATRHFETLVVLQRLS